MEIGGFCSNELSAINGTSTLDGATGIPTNVKIKVTFSEKIATSSAVASNFKLYQGTTLVATNTPVLSADGMSVTITPSALLTDSKEYKLVIGSAVKADTSEATLGADNEVSFTTGSAASVSTVSLYDTGTASVVDAGVTLDEAVASSIVDTVRVAYNKDLDFTSVNTDNVKLYNVTDGAYVSLSSVSYNSANKRIDMVVDSSYNSGELKQNKQYQVEVSNIVGLDGTTASDYTHTFYVTKAFATTPKTADGTALASQVGVNGLLTNDYNTDGTLNKPAFKIVSVFDTALDASTVVAGNFALVEVATEEAVEVTVSYSVADKTLTVVPTANLKDNTQYKFTITKNVKDAYGQSFAANTGYTFTTGDFTAPTVSATAPATGSADVALNSKIVVNFSEAMGTASFVNDGNANTNTDKVFDVNTAMVLVNSTTDTVVNATFAWSNSNKTLTITPAADLTKNNTYTLKLSGKNDKGYATIKDANSKELASDFAMVFNTGAGDLVAPTVAKVTKTSLIGDEVTAGTKSMSATGTVVVKFSEKMDLATLTADDATGTAGTIKLYDVANDAYVNLAGATYAEAHSADNSYSYITLNFDNITDRNGAAAGVSTDLATDTKYRLIVSTGAKDASANANAFESDYSLEFTTGPAPTATLKSFVDDGTGGGTSADNKYTFGETNVPLANATGVAAESKIAIAFSEEVKNVDSNSVIVKDAAGNVVSGTIVAIDVDNTADATDNDEFVFIPSENLAGSSTYTVTITSAVTDLKDNPYVQNVTSFKTVDTAAPSVVSVTPADSTFDVAADSAINIKFDKDMDSTTLTATEITVKQGANTIDATYSYDAASKTLTITPDNYLATNTAYTVTVDVSAVQDVSGNAISATAADKTYTFVTGNVAKTAGIAEAKYYAASHQLVIVLDKPTDTATPDGTSFTLANGGSGTVSSVSVSADKKTLVVTFNGSETITTGVATVALADTDDAKEVVGSDPTDGSASVDFAHTAVTIVKGE